MALKFEDLTSIQKAAIVLVALGKDLSSEVMKHLTESEIEDLATEIANLKDIPPEVEKKILEEYSNLVMADAHISQGGIDYARDLLEKAVGKNKAVEILNRLEGSLKTTGFGALRNIDVRQLISFLQNEHPQTIALILTQLAPQHSAAILSELSPELQSQVAHRIAIMEKISPEVLKEIEEVLESQFEAKMTKGLSASGGKKTIAEILNLVETSAEKNILQSLEEQNADLAAEIKNLMFVFEDIILLDDRSMQKVLKDVETKDLSIALKAASEEVKKKIFSNISERVAVMIKEEMEFMGPMRLTDVEGAQQRIVAAVRQLEESGEIIISGRGGKEEVVV